MWLRSYNAKPVNYATPLESATESVRIILAGTANPL
jgi:hypothetical protein